MHRLRVGLNLNVEFLGEDLDEENVKKEIENYISKKFDILNLKITSNEKTNLSLNYIAETDYDSVINLISNDPSYKTFKIKNKKYLVRMNTHRYFLFRENNTCVVCGLKGDRFVLEKPIEDTHPHFNLYAIENNSYVLMTKDHVLPKCLGGKDHHSNYQTMCSTCNGLKGHNRIPIFVIKQLRDFLNENKSKISRKQLNVSLENIKNSYFLTVKHNKTIQDHTRKKVAGSIVVVNDMCIIEKNNKFHAIPIYENKKQNHIACIKRNTLLNSVVVIDNKYVCVLNKNIFYEIEKNFVKII
jgi:hypothetical protein